MANVTPLFDNTDDYKKKLIRHRAGMGAKYLICAVVVLCAGLGLFFWSRNKSYTEYEQVSSTEHTSTVNTQYAEYNGKLLKYSKDGISCVNAKEEAVWSQTYNMQNPILDICQTAVAVADQQGNTVYVFDAQGLQTEITTLLPIQQVSISAQGVTALLLNDSNVSWIYLYDKAGNKLTEARCSLAETGQPLSVSVSRDGTKVAVSYLQVQEGSAASCVVFYNFGSVGSNFVDKIVSSKVYADKVIPRVKYLSNSVCAAVAGDELIYYEGAEIPEEKKTEEISSEIRSIFFGEGTVGIVTLGSDVTAEAEEEQGKYQVTLYDASGRETLSQKTDLEYTQIKMSGKYLILYDETGCEIYSGQGVLKYAGDFDSVIYTINKSSGYNRFTVVFSDRTETIRLK